MSDSGQRIEFVSKAGTSVPQAAEATSVVAYESAGHLLLIADLATGLALLPRLDFPAVTLVVIEAEAKTVDKQLTDTGTAVFGCATLTLGGYLGSFTAMASAGEQVVDLGISVAGAKARFDLVLDLGGVPLFVQPLPPFGYHAPADNDALEAALATLADSIGEFEKPRYFDYRPELCAHGRSSLTGCTRCIDVCTTGAIISFGDEVKVDPYLCQGCGSCATLCPSGAMTYAFPKPADAIAESRRLSAQQGAHVLLLHTEADQSAIDTLIETLAGADVPHSGLLPLVVEEVSAYGIDYWASMLCSGVHRVLLLVSDSAADLTRQALEQQCELLHALLAPLGVNESVVELVPRSALADVGQRLGEVAALAALVPRHFATHNDKRQSVRSAFDVLREQLPLASSVVALPESAPFGRIQVNTDACTLCMGCVSTCPSGALLDGQDVPALRMVEASCVQCGLCEAACPEQAISLQPQFLYDSVAARKSVTLHETEPFNCVRCHKAFATRAIIERMTDKLADHWMFQDPAAVRRLQMCEDCRVKDLFADSNTGIDVHGAPD